MCPLQTVTPCVRTCAKTRACVAARLHVGVSVAFQLYAALARGGSRHRCCQAGVTDTEPTSQVFFFFFSAEQCALTCLRGCEAKHHQFVSRQLIPRGGLPSCTGKCV